MVGRRAAVELARSLRSSVVVVISGREAARASAMEAGVDAFLPEPYTLAELIACCTAVLARAERSTEFDA